MAVPSLKPVPNTQRKVLYHPAYVQNISNNPVAARLNYLTTETISELAWKPKGKVGDKKKAYTLGDLEEVLLNDDVVSYCYAIKELRSRNSLGVFSHENEFYSKWGKELIEGMEGTLADTVGTAVAVSDYFGFFVAEIDFNHSVPGYRNQWRLNRLIPLSPKTTRFAGTKNFITHVIDRSDPSHPKWIPYSKCIHVTTGTYDKDPYGVGNGSKAIPYFKAKRVLQAEWVVAGKNQSNGMFIAKANSNHTVALLDERGNPMLQNGQPMTESAISNLLRQLENWDSSNWIVTDAENQVNWQPMGVDSGFFNSALDYLDRKLMMTQKVPYLTFQEGTGGFGYTGVASQQAITLDTQIRGLVEQVRDQLIEKIYRPLLVANFGVTAREGWGKFDIDPSIDPNVALQRANTIMGAIAQQIIPSTDIRVINVLRELLGLPESDEKAQLENIQKAAQLQAIQQQAMEQASPQQQGAAPPEGEAASGEQDVSYP